MCTGIRACTYVFISTLNRLYTRRPFIKFKLKALKIDDAIMGTASNGKLRTTRKDVLRNFFDDYTIYC